MASPAPPVGPEKLDPAAQSRERSEPSPVEIDAAHTTTAWNAYDVWRNRILRSPAEKKLK